MRILLTGATGFVGRPLASALAADGHIVHAAIRRIPATPLPAEVIPISAPDLTDEEAWPSVITEFDAIIHLAGIAHLDHGVAETDYDRINRLGTAALAQAAARTRVARFIFVSSIRAQSGPTADHTLTEDDEARPTEAYGRSKLAAEAAVRSAGGTFTILRPVVIYGPGMKGNLAMLARVARLPIPLPLAAFHNRRSLLSLDNLISAIQFTLRTPETNGQTYIVADPQPVTFAQCIASLRTAVGRKPSLFSLPPRLFQLAATALGRSDLWERVGGELVASPARLMAIGWSPRDGDTRTALARLGEFDGL